MRIPLAPRTQFSLEAFRQLRFGSGVRCPHCHGVKVHGWGGFSGRRRYRCLACSRTFSDLTGTPMAYSKRLDRWDPFCECVLASRTVRWTAARLGVHTATAFRWRHRLLDGLRAAVLPCLEGEVSLAEKAFPYSEKGSRRLGRPGRGRGARLRWLERRAWAVLGLDSQGRTLAELTGLRRPDVTELVQALLPRIAPDVTLCDTVGPYGAAARLARRAGLGYRRRSMVLPGGPDGAPPREHPIAAFGRSIHAWLEPFRGVATRYLPNYLAWHGFLHALAMTGVEPDASRIRLLAVACRA